MVKQKGCSWNHCLLAVFDTSCQYWICSVLLLLHPMPVTQQATQETSPLKHRQEKRGGEEILQTPLAPSFSKSYCNTSTIASASQPPLKWKNQELPLSAGAKEINNLKATRSKRHLHSGSPCSQSYGKDTIASTRHLLPPPPKRHVLLKTWLWQVPRTSASHHCPKQRLFPPSLPAPHSCSPRNTPSWGCLRIPVLLKSASSPEQKSTEKGLKKESAITRSEEIHLPHGKSEEELQVCKSAATHSYPQS